MTRARPFSTDRRHLRAGRVEEPDEVILRLCEGYRAIRRHGHSGDRNQISRLPSMRSSSTPGTGGPKTSGTVVGLRVSSPCPQPLQELRSRRRSTPCGTRRSRLLQLACDDGVQRPEPSALLRTPESCDPRGPAHLVSHATAKAGLSRFHGSVPRLSKAPCSRARTVTCTPPASMLRAVARPTLPRSVRTPT